MIVKILLSCDDEEDASMLLHWSKGLTQEVSNGSHLSKVGGGYCSKGHVLDSWDGNEQRNEESSTNIVEALRSEFNCNLLGSCVIKNIFLHVDFKLKSVFCLSFLAVACFV